MGNILLVMVLPIVGFCLSYFLLPDDSSKGPTTAAVVAIFLWASTYIKEKRSDQKKAELLKRVLWVELMAMSLEFAEQYKWWGGKIDEMKKGIDSVNLESPRAIESVGVWYGGQSKIFSLEKDFNAISDFGEALVHQLLHTVVKLRAVEKALDVFYKNQQELGKMEGDEKELRERQLGSANFVPLLRWISVNTYRIAIQIDDNHTFRSGWLVALAEVDKAKYVALETDVTNWTAEIIAEAKPGG